MLETLDLAGIPLRSADRGDEDPIVMAGGPSASNPEPLAPFVDVFFMGEAEEGLLAILDVLGADPDARASASRQLARLPYLYVPARGRHPVERAVYASFDISTQPLQPVVPYASARSSRARASR